MKRSNSIPGVVMAAACAALCAWSAVAAANFPVGTHLYKGTLKDWQNKVMTSSAEVTVQAVATNGAILASTKVADPTADGYNFLLQIPLSTVATDSTAAVGDKLNCVIVQESGLSLAVDPIVVGEANAATTVSLAFVNMKTYTNDTTKAVVQVPAEYIEAIAPWLEAYEKDDYDPFADYDGDGVSNYDEYRAGQTPSSLRTSWRSPTMSRPRARCTPSASSMSADTSTAFPRRVRSRIPNGRPRASRRPRLPPRATR